MVEAVLESKGGYSEVGEYDNSVLAGYPSPRPEVQFTFQLFLYVCTCICHLSVRCRLDRFALFFV